MYKLYFIIYLILLSSSSHAEGIVEKLKSKPRELTELPTRKNKRVSEYKYTYIDREHTQKENLMNLAGVYGASWVLYPLTQYNVFTEKGSFKKYRNNFGKVVFDQDEPFWNWFVHPISGSQLFLYYRANGYSRSDALGMSTLSSLLFEFTIEIYTEPASVQDMYQTPILGSVLGLGIETLSLFLLNSGNLFGKILGHAMNPMTLFWFYEGKVQLIPHISSSMAGLNVKIAW